MLYLEAELLVLQSPGQKLRLKWRRNITPGGSIMTLLGESVIAGAMIC